MKADLGAFHVLLPAKWVSLDLDPTTRAASIDAYVEEYGHGLAGRGLTRADVAALLEGVAAQACALGGVYAAVYGDALGGGRNISASLVVAMVDGQGVSAPGGADPAAVVSALRNLFAEEGEADVRTLASGPALRVRRQFDAPMPGGSRAPVLSVRYLTPVPQLDRLALLEFSTPSLALAEPFADLFDAIAGMGALLAAAFWEPGKVGPVVAELLVLEGERSAPDDLEAEMASLLKILGQADASDLGPRDVRPAEHPIGQSARVRWLVDLARASGGESSAVRDVTQHWIPMGSGPTASLLILSVTTTAIHVGDDVAAVADLVADNISWAG